MAFDMLKTLGALYLMYIGVKVFLDKSIQIQEQAHKETARIIFFRGMLSSLSNAKGFIFYLSFYRSLPLRALRISYKF